jgi:type IV pilus assembly protein PilY1
MNIRMCMRSFFLLARALGVLAFAGAFVVHAEDTDLFLRSPSSDVARPNMLLVIDNAASNNSVITQLPNATGSTKLHMLRDVLNILTQPLTSPYFPNCTVTTTVVDGEVVITRTPADCTTREEVNTLIRSINLGLMIFNPSSGDKGGYVRSHIRRMDVEANRTALWGKIENGIPAANNAPYAKSMHEAYLYFGGKRAYAGFSANQFDTQAQSTADTAYYNSAITDSCQPNFIMFIGNGGPDSSEENDSRALLRDLGGVLSSDPLKFSPSNYQTSWFDEYARTLNRLDLSTTWTGDQKATTYTIAVQSPSDNNYSTAGMQSSRALLQSAALAGGGEYALGQNGEAVLKAILSALRKMQPVNSVFAAVTLPVSVNVRGTFLNQVYMGQFRPDANARPRWPGNLKQYQIGLDANGNPELQDSTANPKPKSVEDKTYGFLLPDITSFWTKPSTYWNFTTMASSDAPDGSVVEKGGAAQRMRTDFATATQQAARKLYTCNGSCGTTGTLLSSAVFADAANSDANGPTVANLGVADAAARALLIDWMRGADNKDDENQNASFTDGRAYVHGDLLHSRPAVVNYNRSPGDRDLLVYYGTNDGVFRAVKGGQHETDGWEKWGIVFPEFFSKLNRLRANDIIITPATPKPYFADGAVSVYQHDVNRDGKLVAADGDKVYLYVGMRRGGRFAYALDVSDPDAPKFLWRIDNNTTDASSGTEVFPGLGQTWSTLRPTNIKATDLHGDPAVIFGAGYDPVNEDPVPALASNTMGQGIFVVNAVTGTLIKHITAEGMGSVPADVTLLDRDSDGKIDRIYAPDSKGNVWRVDVEDADPDRWTVHKIAALGGTGADGRKFLNKIDVVYGSTFDAVLVGSGDREHPFEMSIVDRFYMLQDTFVGLSGGLFCTSGGTAAPCTHANLADVTSNPYQDGSLPSDKNGWYLTLGAGEKVVSSPITVFGTVIFGTNRPTSSTGTCGNLGEARLYQIGFKTGNAVQDLNVDGVVDTNDRFQVLAGGGYPPSPVYSPVEIEGKRRDVVCVGTHCFKPGGANFDARRKRTYWYKKQ